eukprot:m.41108 g.41108  ORF g.41108 m.41108 type:complete len:175 (+) comp33080_c1_seq2:1377-1901(+)
MEVDIDGRRVRVDPKAPITVKTIKEALEEREGIAVEALRLLRGRTLLHDDDEVLQNHSKQGHSASLSINFSLYGGGADGGGEEKYEQGSVLPPGLPQNPRLWTRQQVVQWVQYCAGRYHVQNLDLTKFHMNGRALCLMKESGFRYRVPEKGSELYSEFQHVLVTGSANAAEGLN